MEFWGVEVKPGEVLECDPGEDKYLHISQVALGEIKNTKGNERIILYVHVDDKKVVIGSLVYGKSDQFSLDLVFERDFKLSHSCTTGSVFFTGYTTLIDGGDDEMGGFDDTDSDSEDEQQAQALMSQVKENVGKTEAKPALTTGREGAKVKTEVKPVLASKSGEDEESSDEEEDDEDEDEDMEGSSDEEAESDESDGDSEDESDEEEDKKTLKTAGQKKPFTDSATKTPGPYKKAKTITPSGAQRLGADEGKRNSPKVPGMTSAPTSKEQKGHTPKVKGTAVPKETHKPSTTPGSEKKIGEHTCTPCGKVFATESALSQHNNAKHGKK